MTVKHFQQLILDWHAHNRRDLPWRQTHNPYKILVSEIMLQQTQVLRVLPKYELFLQTFPTVSALAAAKDSKLLEVWAGLGYWRRARFLKEAAKKISKEYGGKFPYTPAELEKLPGVGPYTARALACFAFNSTDAFLDTNIRRVYLHFFFPHAEKVADKEILPIAEQAVWEENPREWHYALFDYGALELKEKTINKRSRHYAKQSEFKGSFRSYRTRALRYVLSHPKQSVPKNELLDFVEDLLRKEERDYSPQEVIDALLRDNLIRKNKAKYVI